MNADTKNSDRILIILSDIEMSQGGAQDDFPHTEFLADFILEQSRYHGREVDLVFNGDTFDFLKTSVDGMYHHLVDEELALRKLGLIEKAHWMFFEALREFLLKGEKPRRIHFIVGNHDQELLFPKVQDRLIELCGNSGQVFFPGYAMRVGDLKVEHGSQKDDMFMVPENRPFLNHNGKKILNLPWASVTLINAFIPLREELYELDRIKPKNQVFGLLPEMKDWLIARLWQYWTKDYLKEYVTFSDPLKKVSWNMIKESVKRGLFFDPDVSMGQRFINEMKHNPEIKVQVVGHGHDPKVVSYGNRKVIEAGCFRDEFMIVGEGEGYAPIPKSYVEVLFKNNRVLSSNMIEVAGPQISPERYPKPIGHYKAFIKELIQQKEREKLNQIEGMNAPKDHPTEFETHLS